MLLKAHNHNPAVLTCLFALAALASPWMHVEGKGGPRTDLWILFTARWDLKFCSVKIVVLCSDLVFLSHLLDSAVFAILFCATLWCSIYFHTVNASLLFEFSLLTKCFKWKTHYNSVSNSHRIIFMLSCIYYIWSRSSLVLFPISHFNVNTCSITELHPGLAGCQIPHYSVQSSTTTVLIRKIIKGLYCNKYITESEKAILSTSGCAAS